MRMDLTTVSPHVSMIRAWAVSSCCAGRITEWRDGMPSYTVDGWHVVGDAFGVTL